MQSARNVLCYLSLEEFYKYEGGKTRYVALLDGNGDVSNVKPNTLVSTGDRGSTEVK